MHASGLTKLQTFKVRPFCKGVKSRFHSWNLRPFMPWDVIVRTKTVGFSMENQCLKSVTENSISPVVVRKNKIALPVLLQSKLETLREGLKTESLKRIIAFNYFSYKKTSFLLRCSRNERSFVLLIDKCCVTSGTCCETSRTCCVTSGICCMTRRKCCVTGEQLYIPDITFASFSS